MERPKVRFTQLFDTSTKNEPESTVQSKIKNKPRVKSIVSTNFPIKILKSGTHVLIKEKNQLDCYQGEHFKYIPIRDKEETLRSNSTEVNSSAGLSDQCSNFFARTDSLTQMPFDDKSIINQNSCNKPNKPIYDQNHIQECVNKLQITAIEQGTRMNSQKKTFKSKDFKNESIDNPTSSEILSVNHDNNAEDSVFDLIQTVNTMVEPKESQNRDTTKITLIDSKKILTKLEDTNETNNSWKKVPMKENNGYNSMNKKFNVFNDELSHSNTTKAFELMNSSHDNLPNNILSTKIERVQEKLQMIPCTKSELAFPQLEDIPEKFHQHRTKKKFLIEIEGNYSKHSEQKKMLHEKYNNSYVNCATSGHIRKKKSLVSNNILNCPELNSTLKTMEKLKKFEKTKSITNLDHLSTTDKNIINGKVSTALDFSPHESIYNNLVDISRSENKFKSTCFMQSGEPRPRDRDVVPRLSDFHNPKLVDQQFIYVNPLILNPVNVDILSASTISEKICLWKIFLENS